MAGSDKKKLVLVVDDHPSILRFVQIGLEIRGFEVITATSGEEALGLIASAKPNIVLLDVVMPQTDGLEVLKRLRAATSTPVIVFSAHDGAREEALRLGAQDFVKKPFHTDDMAARIAAILDNGSQDSSDSRASSPQ